jgi:uncharacterized linocin/CFP29 family protein
LHPVGEYIERLKKTVEGQSRGPFFSGHQMYSLTRVVNVLTRSCENEMVKKRTARRSLSLRTLDVLFDLGCICVD